MKTTKRMVMLAVIAFFAASAVPVASLGVTNARVDIKKMLSNGPHRPPVTSPRVGGQPPPCPSGGNCG